MPHGRMWGNRCTNSWDAHVTIDLTDTTTDTGGLPPVQLYGAVLRDDHTGRAPGSPVVAFREPNGAWRIADDWLDVADVRVAAVGLDGESVRRGWTTVAAAARVPLELLGLVARQAQAARARPTAVVELHGRDGRRFAFRMDDTDPATVRSTLGTMLGTA